MGTFQVFSVISLNFSSRPDKNAASVTKESIEVRHIVLNVRVINQPASTIDQPSQNGDHFHFEKLRNAFSFPASEPKSFCHVAY